MRSTKTVRIDWDAVRRGRMLDMRDCWLEGMSIRATARSTGTSPRTVRRYLGDWRYGAEVLEERAEGRPRWERRERERATAAARKPRGRWDRNRARLTALAVAVLLFVPFARASHLAGPFRRSKRTVQRWVLEPWGRWEVASYADHVERKRLDIRAGDGRTLVSELRALAEKADRPLMLREAIASVRAKADRRLRRARYVVTVYPAERFKLRLCALEAERDHAGARVAEAVAPAMAA